MDYLMISRRFAERNPALIASEEAFAVVIRITARW
jgi:hypothetical protein